jgi:hypothetical protein
MKLKKRALLCFAWSAPLLLLAGWFWWLDASGVAKLAAAKERVRAAGLPTHIEELEPPCVSEADNAAPLIARFSMPSSVLVVNASNFSSKSTPAELDKLASELDSAPLRAALTLIREIAAKPGYDARVKHEPGRIPRIPDDASLVLQGGRLLSAHTRLAIGRGQTEEAYADVEDLLRLGDLFANKPILLTQLIRQAIRSMAIENLQLAANAGGISPNWNRKFSERLAAMDTAKELALSLDGERLIFAGSTIEGLLNNTTPWAEVFPGKWGDIHDWPARLKEQKYRFKGVVREEYAAYLDWALQVRAAVATPGIGFPALEMQLKDAAAIIKPDQIMLKNTNNSVSNVIRRGWSGIAKIVVAQTRLALERYRAAKGEFPATLAELTPEFLRELPVDPYTGKRLLYRREPGGAMIWSPGENLRDDGGDLDDQAWHVRTPEKSR